MEHGSSETNWSKDIIFIIGKQNSNPRFFWNSVTVKTHIRGRLQFAEMKIQACEMLLFFEMPHRKKHLKGKFSSGREGALASKFNYDFK